MDARPRCGPPIRHRCDCGRPPQRRRPGGHARLPRKAQTALARRTQLTTRVIMKNFVKTLIDLVMGAVIPIIILDRFSGPEALGPVAAYIVAAMIPVGWVFIDLFFITKKFNFITSYVGFTSLVGGLLAFWFVDGITYAFKDTVGWLLR